MHSTNKVNPIEKVRAFAEVQTPIWLVQDMLDSLPVEVWSNPDLKWLDPCTGTGIFMSAIFNRLMQGLSSVIPDMTQRFYHIRNTMFYACEIQAESCDTYMVRNGENIFCGSYLSQEFDDAISQEFGEDFLINKFDIVVMNPPYHQDIEGNKPQPLWDKFVAKAVNESLKAGGYLLAVHPSSWRNADGKFKYIQNLLRDREILYLEMHNQKDGIQTFAAEIRYDFYCLRNAKNNDFITEIKCQDGTIERVRLYDLGFIPNGMFDVYNNLLNKNGQAVQVLRDSKYHSQNACVSKTMHDDFIFPLVNYVKKDDTMRLFYTNDRTKGHFGIPKLIFSTGKMKSVGSFLDLKGEYGLTEFAFAIVDEPQELVLIKKCADSERFRAFMNCCAVNDSYFNKRVLSTFRKDFYLDFI
jgi:hypothetical protein